MLGITSMFDALFLMVYCKIKSNINYEFFNVKSIVHLYRKYLMT